MSDDIVRIATSCMFALASIMKIPGKEPKGSRYTFLFILLFLTALLLLQVAQPTTVLNSCFLIGSAISLTASYESRYASASLHVTCLVVASVLSVAIVNARKDTSDLPEDV